jgi:hypothetical protein
LARIGYAALKESKRRAPIKRSPFRKRSLWDEDLSGQEVVGGGPCWIKKKTCETISLVNEGLIERMKMSCMKKAE